MKLTAKLPLMVVGSIILTAAAGGTLDILIGRQVLREAALTDSAQRVEIYANAVHFYLNHARSILETTAQLREFGNVPAAREVAKAILAKSAVFEYVALLAPDGTIQVLEPAALGERLSHRNLSFSAWFRDLQQSRGTIVSNLHISPATQRPAVVIATPVEGAGGRTVAFWIGALRLHGLSEIGSPVGGRAGAGSGYVTDRRGLILAHQTRPLFVEQQTDYSAVPSVRAALAGHNGAGDVFNPVEGEQTLSAYRPLPDLSWAVVYRVPTEIALAPVAALTRGILWSSIALAALIGIAVLVVARRTAAPLARLTAAAQTLGKGRFDERVEAGAGDEIGILAHEFNRMAESLGRQEAELRSRAGALEAANRELEAFSYSVSHDLRAPLRTMDGFSLAVLEDYGDKLDADGRDSLERIRAASQRMGQLIDDLLALSRVSRAELAVKDADLGAIAREIRDSLAQEEPGREVRWEIAGDLKVRADPGLLKIALRNLLANAWKFTGKTEHAVIRVGAAEHNGARVFFVSDNGIGFDMAYAGRLFGAFQRLHQRADFPGTGIGLAIVQRVVRRHGGEIRADAKPGHGATFFFTLGNHEGSRHG